MPAHLSLVGGVLLPELPGEEALRGFPPLSSWAPQQWQLPLWWDRASSEYTLYYQGVSVQPALVPSLSLTSEA